MKRGEKDEDGYQELRAWVWLLTEVLSDAVSAAADFKRKIDRQPSGIPTELPGRKDYRESFGYAMAARSFHSAKAVLKFLRGAERPGPMLFIGVPLPQPGTEEGQGALLNGADLVGEVRSLFEKRGFEVLDDHFSLLLVGAMDGFGAVLPGTENDLSELVDKRVWVIRRRKHGAPPAESIPATPADTGGAPQDIGSAEGGASSPDVLILAGSTSAASLASMPMRNLAMDEVDRWPEGNSRVAAADILKDGMRTRTRVTIPPKEGSSPVVYAVTADPDGTREITIYSGAESMSIELPAEWARALAKELL